jgi:hypothetical protein
MRPMIIFPNKRRVNSLIQTPGPFNSPPDRFDSAAEIPHGVYPERRRGVWNDRDCHSERSEESRKLNDPIQARFQFLTLESCALCYTIAA